MNMLQIDIRRSRIRNSQYIQYRPKCHITFRNFHEELTNIFTRKHRFYFTNIMSAIALFWGIFDVQDISGVCSNHVLRLSIVII
jgi:hypothetical protein